MQLRTYQRKNIDLLVAFLRSRGAAYLADEMGLGKTAQALTLMKMLQCVRILIICPASLRLNWAREFCLWYPEIADSTHCIFTAAETKSLKHKGVVIISFDLASKPSVTKRLMAQDWDFLAIDEGHYLKSPKSKRTKALRVLCKHARYKLFMSGTPAPNGIIDTFPAFNMIAPDLFPEFWSFARTYTHATQNHWGGWDFRGGKNLKEMKQKIYNNFFVRNKKEDVLDELPPKIYTEIPLAIEAPEDYRISGEELKQIEAAIEFGKLPALSPRVATASRGLGVQKVGAAFKYIKTLFVYRHKLVVFCYHRDVISRLKDLFAEGDTPVWYITGSSSAKDRQRQVDEFMAAESGIFIGQIQAAGVGLNLTCTDTCVFLEYSWVPAEMRQAEDRLHRIGQKGVVNIHYLVAQKSMDQKVLTALRTKMKYISEGIER